MTLALHRACWRLGTANSRVDRGQDDEIIALLRTGRDRECRGKQTHGKEIA